MMGVMSAKHPRSRFHHPNLWLILLLAAVLSGCSLSTRPIEPPVVRISGVELMGEDRVRLDLMITNLNPEPLDPSRVMLRVAINDQDWVASEQAINWQVSPSARETVSITVPHLDPQVLVWLKEVGENQRPSVRWSMTLALSLAEDQTIETKDSGFLYRVPGQTTRFR